MRRRKHPKFSLSPSVFPHLSFSFFVSFLLLVHLLDQVDVLVGHLGTLDLHGPRELPTGDGQVRGQNGELLDLLGVADAGMASVVLLDGGLDVLVPDLVLTRLADSLDGVVDIEGLPRELVGEGTGVQVLLGLEADEDGVELTLVANHDGVADGRAEALDLVLDGHWGEVLTT
eukprot:179262_1